MTCVQAGNRQGREHRELAKDHPVTVLYHQSENALDQRVSRGALDKETCVKAKRQAKDFKDIAIVDPEYANGDYKKDIQPDALIAAVLA